MLIFRCVLQPYSGQVCRRRVAREDQTDSHDWHQRERRESVANCDE